MSENEQGQLPKIKTYPNELMQPPHSSRVISSTGCTQIVSEENEKHRATQPPHIQNHHLLDQMN